MTIDPPFLMSFAITRECNLRCKHCYSEALEGKSPDELSTDEAKGLLDELATWRIGLLIMDGGEPLMREDIFELASYASSKGLRVVIGSNGALIDRETAQRLKKTDIKMVSISIDGAKPETHDSFRGEEGFLHQSLKGG